MAISAAVLNDLERLERIILEIGQQANLSAKSLEWFQQVIERVRTGGTVPGGFQDFLSYLEQIQTQAGATATQIADLDRHLAALGPRLERSFEHPGRRLTTGQGPQWAGGGERNITEQELRKTPLSELLGMGAYQEEVAALGGQNAINEVEKALAQYGGTLDNLTRIQVEANGNLVKWHANLSEIPGVLNQVTVNTDKNGNVLRSTQGRLRTFTGGIINNITKVVQWGIAVGVIYGTLRRLQEAMREAVVIQAKLADAQIATSSTAEQLNEVFLRGAEVAEELGVSLEGVIDGYVLAFRAAGNIIDPAERAATAEILLRDSMVLSKLAGIDQAVALDTLVGALRQTGLSLTEGVQLIDKWVAVSKVANVSIGTLAESFAITATSAENVGLSLDELNGFIAAVAEVTTLSATESGNAVRAFMSGFQADQAERELGRYGIAIRDVNGELKAFTTVIEDILARRDVGLISDRELSKIAEIIGGGARRGAQVNAFLENYARVQELAAVSANASGDAAAALAIKMDTLQSSIQNLSNAFTQLGFALGQEGGFLDIADYMVRGLTDLINVLSKIIGLLEDATPAVLALGAAFYGLSRVSSLRNLTGSSKVLDALAGIPLMGGGLGDFAINRLGLGTATTFEALGQKSSILNTLGGTGLLGLRGGLGGGLLGAAIALPDMLGEEKDWADAGASIVGGFLGSMVAGPAGGLVGATIAKAFIEEIDVNATDIQTTMAKVAAGAFRAPLEQLAAGAQQERLQTDIKAIIQEAMRVFGGPLADITGQFTQRRTAKAYTPAIEEFLGARPGTVPAAEIENFLQNEILRALAGEGTRLEALGTGAQLSGVRDLIREALIIGANDPEIREWARELLTALNKGIEQESDALDIETAFDLKIGDIQRKFGGIATGIFGEQRATTLRDVGRGTAGVRELRELEVLGRTFDTTVSTIYAGLTVLANESAEEYERTAKIVINATDEERMILLQWANDLGIAADRIDELREAGDIYAANQLAATFAEDAKEFQLLRDSIEQAQIYRAFTPATRITIREDVTREELDNVIRLTREATANVEDALTLNPTQKQKLIDGYTDVIFQWGDSYTRFSEEVKDVNQEILNDFLKTFGYMDDYAKTFQQIDIPLSQIPQLRGNMQFYENLLEPTGILDFQDLEDIVLLTSDRQVTEIATTRLILNLALQDLIDLNEQQLEGIFNIPEGMTALIPYTGKLYFSDQPIPTAGGGNILEALGPAVYDVEAAVDEQTPYLASIDSNILSLKEARLEPAMAEELTEEHPLIKQMKEFFPVQPQTDRAAEIDRLMDLYGGGGMPGYAVEELQAAMADRYRENPELRLHDRFFGPLQAQGGISGQDVLAALPESIPVTNNIKIELTNPIFLDSTQISNALYERQLTDFKDAKRITGVLGYVVEA